VLALALAAIILQQTASRFDVASVKPSSPNGQRTYGVRPGSDRLAGTNLTLKAWIEIAYGTPDFQVSGGPNWINNEFFDIAATASAPFSEHNVAMQMLQTLLADRFKLTVHRETKDAPVYNLVIARGGIKMKLSADQTAYYADYPHGTPDGRLLSGGGPSELGPGRIAGNAIPMTILTALLQGPASHTVINQTGSVARYDVDLRWEPDLSKSDSLAPSVFTAVESQLGLKLEPSRGPMEMLIIDHVARPDPN
jgi:uncharacterized protein (TIGR03435 family)